MSHAERPQAEPRHGEHELRPGRDPLRIGGAGAELVVDPNASAQAVIHSTRDGFTIEPHAEGPRILLNERALAEPRRLDAGDRLRIGASEVTCTHSGADGLQLSWSVPDDGTIPPGAELAAATTPISAPAASSGEALAPSGQERVESVEFRPFEHAAPRTLPPDRDDRPWIRQHGFRIAAAVGSLALATVFWFTLTAVSVQVLIEPAPDAIALRGTWPSIGFGSYFLARPGDYQVEASRSGYTPLRESIAVDDADNQRFAFTFVPQPGLLNVTTVPNARVFLDGEPLGTTPLERIEVESGRHRIRLEAPRHLTSEETIELQGGMVEQNLRLELIPNWAPISLTTRPAGATVSVDGEARGETPATIDVDAGAHTIELALEGRRPVERQIVVAAGEAQTLDPIELPELDGRLKIESRPAGARVAIDAEYVGKTPLEVPLDPSRPHEVRLSKAGYEGVTRTLKVASGALETVDVALSARIGTVRFDTTPPEAELFIAGKRIGRAGESIDLVATRQRVEVRKSGFATIGVWVEPRAGLEKVIEIELEKEAAPVVVGVAIPVDQLARTIKTVAGQELVLFETPGRFQTGSGRREQGRRSNESERSVELTRSFYVSKYEITNADYHAFDANHDSGVYRGVRLDRDNLPVARVSWEEAVLYCNWLSRKEGRPPAYVKENGRFVLAAPVGIGYRLLTEAEWSWVARYANQPEPLRYPWGTALPVAAGAGNVADKNAASSFGGGGLESYDDGFAGPAPVGSFTANASGLFDIGGNVAEWVHDLYAIRSPGGADPQGPANGKYNVIRGSSWKHSSITQLRLAYRDYGDKGREDVGFRIARYAQ